MHLLNPGLGCPLLLLLLLTACQSSDPARYQSQYQDFTESSREMLTEKLAGTSAAETQPVSQPEASRDDTSPTHTIDSVYLAQQLALQHSHRIEAIFIELGIHEAEAVQHRLLANPGVELSLMRPENGGRWQMEFAVSLGLLDWLSRQQRITLAESESAGWQAQAWQLLTDELSHVAEVWLDAVAAQHTLEIHRELQESASVAEDFAGLLFEAGNISELELLSSQSIADQRSAELVQAQSNAAKALIQLQHVLGLDKPELAQTPIQVPDQLPAVTQAANQPDADQLIQLAHAHQPALQLVKSEQQQHAANFALALRRIGLRDAGLELITERESDGERQQGFALSLTAPVFDNGDTELSVLHGRLQSVSQQQRLLESVTRAGIQAALQDMQSAQQQLDLLLSDELPRLQRMMALSVQEYNFMLRGTFELLTVADLTLDARLRQVNASAQYWQASWKLENLIGTRLQEITHD